ncbi:lysine-2,3-aminomutase-like protein [Frigidibacter oleivorans]|uniref:lysine-2,3-aminomutase-like protein n=1 Tax=Frigidibacter oleivorans TaxID=2487129 RepID=UPI000F8CE463|nr:lysine-2,3-aminomutase-like protein [Frigidibacter oleivorans]
MADPLPLCPPHRLPRALTSIADLRADGLVAAADAPALEAVAAEFRVRLSPAMRAALRDPGDAVARQFLPDRREARVRPEELADPIGDAVHSPVPGLTHRYPDRVILHVTQTCEVYCRFCFRREGVGSTGALPADQLDAALAHVAAHPAIREVILTGGDPMSLSARRIGAILDRLATIPHVGVVRFHTRVPVVAPERIDAGLIAALDIRPAVHVVVHTNHADEIGAEARAALRRLSRAGIPLLSQTVLLRGINDSVGALETLFRTLIENRVTPYYLHHCDLARGTSHFRTTIAEGRALVAALRGRISGLCQPTYVLDIPGGHGKAPLTADNLRETGEPGHWQVRDWQGRWHDYRDPVRD